MSISKAITRGEVFEQDHRIDTAHPTNRAYLKADHDSHKQNGRSVKPAQRVGGKGISAERRAKLWEQKQVEAIKALQAKTAQTNAARARLVGLMVERAAMERVMVEFGKEWKVHVIDRVRSMVSEIYAMAQQGKPVEEAQRYADQETSELTKALKDKVRALGLGDLP